MVNKDKVALFDFCETLANFQTADAFVDFVRQRCNSRRMKLFALVQRIMERLGIILILSKLTHCVSLNKKIIAYQLKGFPEVSISSYANDYYQSVVRINLINQMIEEMKRLKSDGYKIVILSAGYDVYLRCFCREYGINEEDLICTHIGFDNGVCTGRFVGEDCINEYKISYLEKHFSKNEVFCVAFSDSVSDLPMLNWADRAFVVLKKGHKDWTIKYNFNKILWE